MVAAVIIPVLLSTFLGPGMGQIYNREYKKAAILIGISAAILVAGFVWFQQQLQSYLPADLTALDADSMKALATSASQDIYARHRSVLHAMAALLMTMQIYSIWDAYRVAIRKRGND